MESKEAAKPQALPRTWAFQPAGELHFQLLSEYLGHKKPDTALKTERFDATKRLFVDADETLLAHLKWREEELLLLCLEIIGECEYKLNPEHPYFTSSPQDWEYLVLEDTHIPPVKEPSFTRLELETTAADWYLNTKQKTGFQIPVGGKHKEDGHLPESVQYYRWKRCNDDAKIMGESAQLNTSPKTKDDTKNWWIVKWEDLDSTDLNKAEVIQKILHWINEDKEMTDEAKGDMQVNLESALGSAQRRTSERHSAGNPLPLRISRRSKYKLERLAMIDPGFQGGDSAKYRLIKNSRLN